MSEMEQSSPVQEEVKHPKPRRSCADLTEYANERVSKRKKYFVIKSSLSAEGACAGEGCGPVEVDVRPCFELRWGDGEYDQIETDDFEILHIVASNPYSNVLFKDVTIVLSEIMTDDGQTVPTLPDGTPSVDVTPTEFICFGDLPPGDGHASARHYVSREMVLVSRGAKPGDYVLSIGYCFTIETFHPTHDKFKLELVAS